MLVLGRKPGETIKIGDDIKVMVVDVRPGNVRIGIEAPDEVPITRPDRIEVEPSAKRTTLLSYIADLRRRFNAVLVCLDAVDAGTPAVEAIEAIRKVVHAPQH